MTAFPIGANTGESPSCILSGGIATNATGNKASFIADWAKAGARPGWEKATTVNTLVTRIKKDPWGTIPKSVHR